MKAPLRVRRVVPSSRRKVVLRPQQAPRAAQRPGRAKVQQHAEVALNSCNDTPHTSNCVSCRSRLPATTRHRVRTSVRRAAARERRTSTTSQPMLGSCEGTTAKKRGGVMDSATRTRGHRCRVSYLLSGKRGSSKTITNIHLVTMTVARALCSPHSLLTSAGAPAAHARTLHGQLTCTNPSPSQASLR